MRALAGVKRAVDWLVNVFMAGVFTLVFLVVLVQIFYRYVLNSPLVWSEELSRFIFIWICLVGWAQAVRSGTHIRITFIEERLPAWLRRAVNLSFQLIMMAFFVVLIWLGCLMVSRTVNRSLVTLPEVSVGLLYASLPISALICLFYSLYNLLLPDKGPAGATNDPA
ncbi:MAG: TRAP transporter small permease [Planctomycetota bacterium]|jgi:TRAP-type C4-dicarboxylate transport system permease small subunit|nr:TRAP transporter small permease [Planctomycetota bacterium]